MPDTNPAVADFDQQYDESLFEAAMDEIPYAPLNPKDEPYCLGYQDGAFIAARLAATRAQPTVSDEELYRVYIKAAAQAVRGIPWGDDRIPTTVEREAGIAAVRAALTPGPVPQVPVIPEGWRLLRLEWNIMTPNTYDAVLGSDEGSIWETGPTWQEALAEAIKAAGEVEP